MNLKKTIYLGIAIMGIVLLVNSLVCGQSKDANRSRGTTEEKIQKAIHQIGNEEDVSGYEKMLNDPDPYVRAGAASCIRSFSMSQIYFGTKPSEKLMNKLAEMAEKDMPPVSIEAAAAYLEWMPRKEYGHIYPFEERNNMGCKAEVSAEIMGRVVDLLDNQDEYVKSRAFDLCERVITSSNFFDTAILDEKIIDALAQKIISSKDEKIRSKTRYFLGIASYFFRSKRGLDFMLKDFEAYPDDYGYHSPYEIIALLNAKEYIPLLKQRLAGANDTRKEMITAALMKLGVDVYDVNDFSSPNKVVINFWKLIKKGDLEKARSLLDPARLNEEAINTLIDDHKEILNLFDVYQLTYDLGEHGYSRSLYMGEEEGYGDKLFGNCMKDVYILSVRLPDGYGFHYFLRKNKDSTWLIHEIKGLIPKVAGLRMRDSGIKKGDVEGQSGKSKAGGQPQTQGGVIDKILENHCDAYRTMEEFDRFRESDVWDIKFIGSFEYISPFRKGIFCLADGSYMITDFGYTTPAGELERSYGLLRKDYKNKKVVISGRIFDQPKGRYIAAQQGPEGFIHEFELKLQESIKDKTIYFVVKDIYF